MADYNASFKRHNCYSRTTSVHLNIRGMSTFAVLVWTVQLLKRQTI